MKTDLVKVSELVPGDRFRYPNGLRVMLKIDMGFAVDIGSGKVDEFPPEENEMIEKFTVKSVLA
jgi:hypothetical protein